MSAIEVVVSGGGYAWVDNPNPSQGDTVTLTCVPFTGAQLEDIYAYEEHGYSVALYVQEIQTFEWAYQSMTIYVEFTEPKIHIYIDGDGTAVVSNEYPTTGETVTLTCVPDMGKRVKKIEGYDENGNPVTFRRLKEQDFVWNYQSLDIYVTFGRRIPHRMPIEMYPIY